MTECKPQTWEDEGGVAVEIFLMLYICYGFYVITDFYLVPAISKVCSQLRIPDDVAGATILGAALNAPELFSSIISIFILKNPVGVGLIMGSFNFNLLCITGFTSLFSRQNLRARQLKLEWRYLQRDVFFYALAVVLLIVTTWDEHLGWQDCVSLLGLYVAYVEDALLEAMKYLMKRGYNIMHEHAEQNWERKHMHLRAASDGHTTPSLLSTSVPADSPANDILSLDETIAAGSDNPREDQEPVEKPTRATAGPPSAQSSELPVSCPYQAPTPSLNGDPTMTTSGARPRSNTLQIPNLIARAQQMRLSSPGQKWDWSSARAGAASSEFRRPRAGSLLKVDARLITVATDRKARMPFAPDVMDLAAAEEVTMEHDEAGEILHWPADAPPTAKAVFVITLPLRIMAWCTMPRTPREQKTVAICGALIWLPVLAYALELSASRAACVVGIPDELVGKTLVAIGTSLPNVLAAVAAGRRGQVETAVSQAFGSNIFDILIAFALPYTIQCGVRGWEPVKLEAKSVASEGTADIVILGCFVLALFYTRMRLTKGLGMILVGGYAVYLVYTCLNFYNIHTSFRITI
eukprot:gene8895-10539_t